MHLNENTYKLTPYLLDKKSKFALILPGGGYFTVSETNEGEAYAKVLNEMGYSAFVLRYHVRRKGRFPIPLEDVAQALNEIIGHSDEWNLDMEGWSLWGSSAGGHLAACYGTESLGWKKYHLPKPSALILAYPVITMGTLKHAGSAFNLLGPFHSKRMELKTSVERHITPDFPSTFVWCSKTDEIVNWRNSFLLAHELKVNHVNYEFKRFETGHHGSGLSIGTEPEGWIYDAIKFWEANQ